MVKKSFVKGAIILGLASIICKILGAIFRVPLTYLLGTEGVGIYQLVYPIFALFLVASTSGIPVGLSKIISQENSKGNYKNIKIIFVESLKIMIFLGLCFALFIVIFSGIIASLQGNFEIKTCYLVLAPSIILGSVISIFRGYFQGFEIMNYSALSQVIEQLFKVAFGLFFAYLFLPVGLIYGVVGALVGLMVSELVSFIYLFIVYKKKKISIDFNENKGEIYSKKSARKIVIKEALPITLTTIIIPLTSVVESLIIIKLLSNVGFNNSLSTSLYGLDSGVVASLINLPSVIAISLAISLMPSISSSFALQNKRDINFKTKLATKIVWYFTLPCLIIFFIFSKEICYFLYGNFNSNSYNQLLVASTMLKLSSFSILYIALNHIFTTILQAINESYYAFVVLLISSVIKIILTIVLVLNKQINIYGLVVADVVCYALACLINLRKIKQELNISFSFKEALGVPIVANFCLVGVLLLFKFFVLANLNRLLILVAIASGFIAYLIVVIMLKGFNFREISNTKLIKLIKNKKY